MPTSKNAAKRRKQLANLSPAPPAPPGNGRAVTHGALGLITIEPGTEAAQVLEAIKGVVPMRGPDGDLPPEDGLVAERLAIALVRLKRLNIYLDEHGVLTRKGGLRPAADLERQWTNLALGLFEALGLTARSRARLGIDVARGRDLAREWAAESKGEGSDHA